MGYIAGLWLVGHSGGLEYSRSGLDGLRGAVQKVQNFTMRAIKKYLTIFKEIQNTYCAR